MTKEEEKLLDLCLHFLKEKRDSNSKIADEQEQAALISMFRGKSNAFQEMISFTENLKRTL